MQTRIWLGDLREGRVIRRAIKTAIIVGITLVAITQGASILAGEFTSQMAWQIPLTVMVPFTVSLLTSATVVGSARRANSAAHGRLRDQLEAINKFPNMNPNPVMRVSLAGDLLYSNSASDPITSALGISEGDRLPASLFQNLTSEVEKELSGSIEVPAGVKTYSLFPVLFGDLDFINVYGTDITAMKVLNKFPDLNPNPVMKMTGDGTLDYANAAADAVVDAMGMVVGGKFSPDIIRSIEDICHDRTDEPLLVSGDGRTYSLKPVYTPEFEITNIYGLDITARIAMNKFPDQNPNPVLRVSIDGNLEYANPASEPICKAMGIEIGEKLPAVLMQQFSKIADSGSSETIEVEADDRVFSLLVVAVFEFNCINIYGTDITAMKVLNKFPDLNPSPVMRMSPEGRLEYANSAGAPVVRAMGMEVGDLFSPEMLSTIEALRSGKSSDPLEVSGEGRTYSLTPVHTREFDITNIYGDDITARIAMNKFPDQNPNPVLRISNDQVVEYANPASELTLKAIGARVGESLPEEFFAKIKAISDSGSSESVEVSTEGRTFSLLVVGVFEFGFINLYGTEITATLELEEAHKANELLLLNILPASIADRLKKGEGLIADRFEDMSVLFADVVGFTQISRNMSPSDLVEMLNHVFSLFDRVAERLALEKIKTIGDAYMVAGGLGTDGQGDAERLADMGLEMLELLAKYREETGTDLRIRIGMHTGPAVAGVVGLKKFIYDIWGETVNTASRMESHGVPNRIQVLESTTEKLAGSHIFEERGKVDVKGIGMLNTYFLTGRRDQQNGAGSG
ncbi:MAG: adenylate/guanylate cyclase domain-containing protein [Chloroflexi bacterium]|nr:adenylate/guanylate cyclase domain-containing protein [Chloroflexota bacterium]MCH8113952.1 adenylate/guanylate cyclase domain-containing protein [Chloroflexota bacterium]MCI0835778.1 adenylate/guanylate cyclase domain-containing protein [Chloroflexota bacterium]